MGEGGAKQAALKISIFLPSSRLSVYLSLLQGYATILQGFLLASTSDCSTVSSLNTFPNATKQTALMYYFLQSKDECQRASYCQAGEF